MLLVVVVAIPPILSLSLFKFIFVDDFLGQRLSTFGLSDPDLVLRTSGEYRLSNFLLFECAYAELFFLEKFWPEVTKADLETVLRQYDRRVRRFGS
jgi:undecaprenyl diphosphate synthase